MHLYLVVATDANGDSKDLFVTAKSPAEAVDLWFKYYGGDDEDRVADGVRVFLAPTTGAKPLAHRWTEPVLDTTS